MKKVVCVIIALLLCFSLLTPAFAAGDEFVFSISYKDGPGVVVTPSEDGSKIVGYLVDKNDTVLEPVYEEDLAITPVSAYDSSVISQEKIDTLNEIYQGLRKGEASLPYALYGANAPKRPVVRDLFDMSLLDSAQSEKLAGGFVDFRITFRLGVAANVDVYIMSYENGTWTPAKITNNGNGTVTATFEHLCPVAIAVDTKVPVEPPRTADKTGNMIWIWAAIMVASAAAVCVLTSKTFKKKTTN